MPRTGEMVRESSSRLRDFCVTLSRTTRHSWAFSCSERPFYMVFLAALRPFTMHLLHGSKVRVSCLKVSDSKSFNHFRDLLTEWHA